MSWRLFYPCNRSQTKGPHFSVRGSTSITVSTINASVINKIKSTVALVNLYLLVKFFFSSLFSRKIRITKVIITAQSLVRMKREIAID